MYAENRKSINAFVGCLHNCVYCKPSFQQQAKRQKRRCNKCYNYEPHFHPERLTIKPPKTKEGEFIFFPSMGDPCFASPTEFETMLDYAKQYPLHTFLIQTKNPEFLQKHSLPYNVIVGTTLETNKCWFPGNPSKYKEYEQISTAPLPYIRFIDMKNVPHKRKSVTVEPILESNTGILSSWIRQINPEFVYVGYDNHDCKLPEPRLTDTMTLIEELKKFTEVRLKSLRKAWYEP